MGTWGYFTPINGVMAPLLKTGFPGPTLHILPFPSSRPFVATVSRQPGSVQKMHSLHTISLLRFTGFRHDFLTKYQRKEKNWLAAGTEYLQGGPQSHQL